MSPPSEGTRHQGAPRRSGRSQARSDQEGQDRQAGRPLARPALVKQDLPEAWIPPEEIPQLRARTRLRKSLADDRTRWAQRLHVVLYHAGWACRRSQLLTQKGRQWVATLQLTGAAQQQVTTNLLLIEALEAQLRPLETGSGASPSRPRC